MTTDDRVVAEQESDSRLNLSRRRAIQGAAWSVPVISVATAAPAFAGSGAAVLSATYNGDSFRANSNAELTAGTPSAGGFVCLALTVTPSAAITDLKCDLTTSNNGVSLASNTVMPARGTTTWQLANADLATAGFTSTAVIGGPQATAITFTKSTPTAANTAVTFKVVHASIAGADFPLVYKFSTTSSASTVTVTVTSPGSTPFLSGAVS